MRLHEHEAARFFQQAGVPVAPFAVVRTADEAVAALGPVGLPVVLKAQVLVGSRGKHGGILLASTPEEVREKAAALLAKTVRGLAVESLMVAKAVSIARELYVGVTVDAVAGAVTVILGTAGGIDVETVAKEQPEALFRKSVVPPWRARPASAAT
jgi:succinyl-CoA synthetase beta subunit